MAAHRTRTRWTYAEFARLPSEGGGRNEIIDGELVVTPAPTLRHQRILGKITARLTTFVETDRIGVVFPGPVDILFAEGDYLEPDLVFVAHDHASFLSDRAIEGPPDLVVEVTSPSTRTRDRGTKLQRYRHFGVGEYWIVDPDDGTVEVWKRGTSEPEVVTDTLVWLVGGERLEISLEDVFRN